MYLEYVSDLQPDAFGEPDAGRTLDRLTHEYTKAHGVPYGVAFSEVQKAHPDLAMQYAEALRSRTR